MQIFCKFISFRSNCHMETADELRKHYQKPQFLPLDSECSQIDWIFMGWHGQGADIHVG